MPETQLIPLATKAIELANNIKSLIPRTKEKKIIERAQLEWTKVQTEKLLAEAKARNAGEIIRTNLEELVRTQADIDMYISQGRLNGKVQEYATKQLYLLADHLEKNFSYFNR